MTTEESSGSSSSPLFTDRMRAATHQHHDDSNRLVNLKLALVLTSPVLYGEALGLFLPVFEKLEAIMDEQQQQNPNNDDNNNNHHHPQLAKLCPLMDTLRRSPGFRADLAFYLPKERREELEHSWKNGEHAVIAEYVGRLEHLKKTDPLLLLAYVYHLYGGVVAGGQIVARMVKKAMGLKTSSSSTTTSNGGDNNDNDEGVKAFQVKDDGNFSSKGFFQRVRKIYNEELDLTAEEQQRIIEEGKEVFRLNDALIATVKGTPAWQVAADNFTKRMIVVTCLPFVLYFAWHVFSVGSGGVLRHGY